ncbi:Txe/YoeB family addiction module toxin [Pseudomonas entomophila]|uniref:Txe/YoeB family addiction module toxin n=1 Tax=Pseudomonas entomophila TaxID=312306 RepID=UPI002406103F|nr:Txe/YoeB family addiction module toxin [Pseudomonas entomophila]MDF9619938.1 Txe/YoeB family addiction module toxin [Pseudomonas entomophila]
MSQQKKKQRNKQEARTSVSISFTLHGWDDYQHWKSNDEAISAEVDRLLCECLRTPFTGTGKPEALRGDLTGYYSRRITKTHRLVYLYEAGTLTVLACRYHYE